MTFSILMIRDDQPKVVGMLWANDQASAEAIAPEICGRPHDRLRVCVAEDREIPLRIAAPRGTHVC